MNYKSRTVRFGLLLLLSCLLLACDDDIGSPAANPLVGLIELQVSSVPLQGKTCEIMPSSSTTLHDYQLRVSQVSECSVQGQGSSFTDNGFSPSRVEYFGPGQLDGLPDSQADIDDHFLSQCKIQREKYLRIVAPVDEFACWNSAYENIVELSVSPADPSSPTQDCVNMKSVGASDRHANDWACLAGKTSTFSRGYQPVTLNFGVNGCSSGTSIPADISGLTTSVRAATQTEKEAIWYAKKSNTCGVNNVPNPNQVNIYVPDSLGRIGYSFYDSAQGMLKPSVWEGGSFSSDKFVTFRLRESKSATEDQQTCGFGYLQFIRDIVPTMKVQTLNPTQNSAFCYAAPADYNFQLSTTDIGVSQPDKECYHLNQSNSFICYPKRVAHNDGSLITTRLQVTGAAVNNLSRCTRIEGNGLPVNLVQNVCVTETIIDGNENWAPGEPSAELSDNCVALRADGKWDNRNCGEIRSFTCQNHNDPNDWKITEYKGTWEEGFEACNQLPGGPYTFERPSPNITFGTTAVTSRFLLQAAAPTLDAWINYHEIEGQDQWSIGDQYNYFQGPINSNGGSYCTIIASDSQWKLVPCNFSFSTGTSPTYSPNYVCRIKSPSAQTGAGYRITKSSGPWQDGFEECKKLDKGQFHFFKPQNSDENGGATILSQTQSPARTSWINFITYQNMLMIPSPFRNFNNAPANTSKRCAAMDTSGGWIDTVCTESRAYTCRDASNSNNWIVTDTKGSFERGFRVCHDLSGGKYEFSVPHSIAENNAVMAKLTNGVQPWVNFHLAQYQYDNEWEPANAYDFSENTINLSGINAFLSGTSFNAVNGRMATKYGRPQIQVTVNTTATAADSPYKIDYDSQKNVIGISITTSSNDKLLSNDVLYVAAQAIVDQMVGRLPDEQLCTTDKQRYPLQLDDTIVGTPTDGCVMHEMLAQVYMAYLMHGSLSMKELEGYFADKFPMGVGRKDLLTGGVENIDFTRADIFNLSASDVVIDAPRRRMASRVYKGPSSVKGLAFLDIVLLRINLLLAEQEKLNNLPSDNYSSTVYVQESKTSVEDWTDAVHDGVGVCDADCAADIIDNTTKIVKNPEEGNCHSLLSGPQQNGRNTAELLEVSCSSQPSRVLCEKPNGEFFAAANSTTPPQMLFDVHSLCSNLSSGATPVNQIDDLTDSEKAGLNTFLSTQSIDSSVGLVQQFPKLCMTMTSDSAQPGSYIMGDTPVSCDKKVRMLCQNLDNSIYKLTQNKYSVGMADEACAKEFVQDVTDTFDDTKDFFFASDVERYTDSDGATDPEIGSGAVSPVETTRRLLTGQKRGRSFDMSGEQIEKAVLPFRLVYKKLKSYIVPEQPSVFNLLKTISINVGQGSCHAIVCDARPSGKGVETVFADCGSNGSPSRNESEFANQIKIATNGIGAAYQLLWSGAFLDRNPTLVVSHSDKDHYNFIRRISLMELRSITEILGYEDVYFGGRANAYTEGDLSAYFNGLYMNGTRINDVVRTPLLSEIPDWTLNARKTIKQFPECGGATLDALVVNYGASANPNEKSVVLQLSYGNFYTAILPGDAWGTTEGAALARMSNPLAFQNRVLIASHHGSSLEDSNSLAWRQAIQPTHLIYSSGSHRTYNHPHYETVHSFEGISALNSSNVSDAHSICVGYKPAGQQSRQFLEKQNLQQRQYSTYSSGTITSTVLVPQGETDELPQHIFTLGKEGPDSLGICDGVLAE